MRFFVNVDYDFIMIFFHWVPLIISIFLNLAFQFYGFVNLIFTFNRWLSHNKTKLWFILIPHSVWCHGVKILTELFWFHTTYEIMSHIFFSFDSIVRTLYDVKLALSISLPHFGRNKRTRGIIELSRGATIKFSSIIYEEEEFSGSYLINTVYINWDWVCRKGFGQILIQSQI